MNMKSLGFMLSVVLISLSTVALAQSDAQKSFDKLKILAGIWKGPLTTDPAQPGPTQSRVGFVARNFQGKRARA